MRSLNLITRNRYVSARSKRRHPCEKGLPEHRKIITAFQRLIMGHKDRPHPAPFSKTAAGRRRHQERHFALDQDLKGAGFDADAT
jgi:hypothetical protein